MISGVFLSALTTSILVGLYAQSFFLGAATLSAFLALIQMVLYCVRIFLEREVRIGERDLAAIKLLAAEAKERLRGV